VEELVLDEEEPVLDVEDEDRVLEEDALDTGGAPEPAAPPLHPTTSTSSRNTPRIPRRLALIRIPQASSNIA
jgi:hypothetical protein